MAAQQAMSTLRGRPAHGSLWSSHSRAEAGPACVPPVAATTGWLPAPADSDSGSEAFTRQSRVLERWAGTQASSQPTYAAADRLPADCQHDKAPAYGSAPTGPTPGTPVMGGR